MSEFDFIVAYLDDLDRRTGHRGLTYKIPCTNIVSGHRQYLSNDRHDTSGDDMEASLLCFATVP